MTLRRHLATSLVIQGGGSAAVLLATLALGFVAGSEAQGVFSRTKAEVEFLAALTMFGMPQALFFYSRSGRVGRLRAMRWTFACVLLTFVLCTAYAGARGEWMGIGSALFGAAVAAFAAHALLRALVLVRAGSSLFNLVTVLPQVLVLAGVLVLAPAATHSSPEWSLVFTVAFGSAAAVTCYLFSIRQEWPARAADASARDLCSYGVTNWLGIALSAGAIVLIQFWVEREQGLRGLGKLTMGLAFAQIVLTPFNYAAPLLFRHWMGRSGSSHPLRLSVCLSGMVLLVPAALWVVIQAWPNIAEGSSYEGISLIVVVLLLGTAADAMSKLLVVSANASGKPESAVGAEVVRCMGIASGLLLMEAPSLMAICAVWVASAWAAAIVLAVQEARMSREERIP